MIEKKFGMTAKAALYPWVPGQLFQYRNLCHIHYKAICLFFLVTFSDAFASEEFSNQWCEYQFYPEEKIYLCAAQIQEIKYSFSLDKFYYDLDVDSEKLIQEKMESRLKYIQKRIGKLKKIELTSQVYGEKQLGQKGNSFVYHVRYLRPNFDISTVSAIVFVSFGNYFDVKEVKVPIVKEEDFGSQLEEILDKHMETLFREIFMERR